MQSRSNRFIYKEKSVIIAEKNQVSFVKIYLTLFKHEEYHQAAPIYFGASEE